METAFILSFYVACFTTPAALFGMCRYIFKYFKTDSLRDKSHYQVCALLMLICCFTSFIVLILTYNL